MGEVWCRRGVEVVGGGGRRCGGGVEKVWRRYGDGMEEVWREVWRRCGERMARGLKSI